MEKTVHDAYVRIIHGELVEALGCTEPIAVAYCSAWAARALGCLPDKIRVSCSGNIVKNVKGVVVPNSGGRKGIEVAAVLGAVAGDPDKGLEVLTGVCDEDRETMARLLKDREYCRAGIIRGGENLHIIVTASAGGHAALAEIRDEHTRIVRLEKDGAAVPLPGGHAAAGRQTGSLPDDKELLSVKGILEFADSVDLDLVRGPLELQMEQNMRISREGLTNDYGVRVGKSLMGRAHGNDLNARARALAAAGSDARMSGCALPVVINSGSGNQGITVSMPVMEYARDIGADHEKQLRALVVSNLLSIHQKRFLGSLSAYCGATSAACGAVCGIAYMCGYGYDTVANIITNTLATISGMVCDGAKPSCAAKIASALDAAFMAFDLEMNGDVFAPGDGLVRADVEQTIRAVGQMGREGMRATDSEILDIMLSD